MAKSPDLYIGIMSGTSFDGIDIALIDCRQNRTTLVETRKYPMPASLKQRLHVLTKAEIVPLHWLGQIDHQLGHLYADVAARFL